MKTPDYNKIKEEAIALKNGKNLTRGELIVYEQCVTKELPQICVKCGRTEKLGLDHIVSKYILRMFGVDVEREIIEGNYRILCIFCNHFKGPNLDFTTPETKEVLKKLIERI